MPNVTLPEHPSRKLRPHHVRSNNSILGQAISPSPGVRETGPKGFLGRQTLFSQSTFPQGYSGHEAMEN